MLTLNSDIYHEYATQRRKLPCPSTRLYGDLLPLIVVDASTPREFSIETRAKCNTLTKQMEKKLRTYYLRRQQILGHLEGERRKLYKTALALHKAKESAERYRLVSSLTKSTSGTTFTTVKRAQPVSTRPPIDEEMLTSSSSMSISPQLLPIVIVHDSESSDSLADDELLIPSLSPDAVEQLIADELPTIADIDCEDDENADDKEPRPESELDSSEKPESDHSSAGSSNDEMSMASGSPERISRVVLKQKKSVTLSTSSDENGDKSSEEVFLPGVTVRHKSKGIRWPKMQHPSQDGLETILESRQTEASSSSSSQYDEDQATPVMQNHSVKVTITMKSKSTADSEVSWKSSASSKSAMTKLIPVSNRSGQTPLLLPQIMTSKLSRPSDGDGVNSRGQAVVIEEPQQQQQQHQQPPNQRQPPTPNLQPRDSFDQPINYYKMSLISIEDPTQHHLRGTKKKKPKVMPLIPGKSRYIDWQLQPDGNYKSRIVTYEEPRFKFSASDAGAPAPVRSDNLQNLRISGKRTTKTPSEKNADAAITDDNKNNSPIVAGNITPVSATSQTPHDLLPEIII